MFFQCHYFQCHVLVRIGIKVIDDECMTEELVHGQGIRFFAFSYLLSGRSNLYKRDRLQQNRRGTMILVGSVAKATWESLN